MASNRQFDLAPELSLSEAAEILGLDRRTVKKLIEQGVLPARIASPPSSRRPRYRIPEDEVLRLRNTYHRQPVSHGARKQVTRRRSAEGLSHIQLDLS